MKKVTFYYVRHGGTLFNVLNRMQGWCDSPLTDQGIREAEEAKELLKSVCQPVSGAGIPAPSLWKGGIFRFMSERD